MDGHENAAPVDEKFLTPGVMVMISAMAVGLAFVIVRLIEGIGAVSNLNNQYPWGLWVGVDVASGVALAAGGFTTGLIAYVFNRQQYHAVIRPALLTAMLGYTFVVIGLVLDLGRYWNITSPIFNHNANSVLFEVAICVMIYLTVLYIEFIPIVIERFKGRVDLPGFLGVFDQPLEKLMAFAEAVLGRVMFVFIIAGIVLSCLHQSSLGSLMLIAPSKIHPLWYTPILPLLFLLSAFATGYPMVIFESIIVSKSFNRRIEMEVLTPLSRFMPVLIGLYLSVKLGDMVVRGTWVYLLDGTYQTNAFMVEVVIGVMLPFVLVLFRRVRESAGWLFFAASIYVAGIVFNRINVFMVSYTPPYKLVSYFPAVGEIFITIGLVAALMFLYRVVVFIFPVLGDQPRRMSPVLLVLLSIITLAAFQPGTVRADAGIKATGPSESGQTPVPSVADAPALIILDNPVINQSSDRYEPVRFMHRKHANVLEDCSICHHRQADEKNDTTGIPVTLALMREKASTPSGCVDCHREPFVTGQLHIPGLKGAYHQLCMDCHQESEQIPHVRGPVLHSAMVRGPIARTLDTRAPTDCLSCHAKRVPDHQALIELSDGAGPLDVTRSCLSCHPTEGEAILKTSHWNWHGPSVYTIGHENRVDLGKDHAVINNFCINLAGNEPRCTSCHIGYGWKDDRFDFSDMSRIDCLVCHDTTGTYTKSPAGAGMPDEKVDLVAVARQVGRPSRANCGGACHFRGGGGDAVKHGDMSSNLLEPDSICDVHMGNDREGMDFRCQDCHKTRNHMISGRSISVPAVEGDLSCEYCHTDRPHIADNTMTAYHLNQHGEHVACQTCHIPIYAKCNPTKTSWDWSTAGQDIEPAKDKYGLPTYAKQKGSFEWKEAVKPAYRWYNGTVQRHLLGDTINTDDVIELTKPVGSINDPAARIYPFKIHWGKQISDARLKQLIAPKLWGGYWTHWDWDVAAKEGMQAAGLPYSGEYEFVETVMYWGLTHEVMPKEHALSCAHCHESLAKAPYCGGCHQERRGVDFRKLATQGVDFEHLAELGRDVTELIGHSNYIDFKMLGYDGDPIETGGRFKKLPLVSVKEGDLNR
jgi:octaheme c-type cytochrome (tetrathionate reductase family)